MNKNLFILGGIGLMALIILIASQSRLLPGQPSAKLKIAASFYPLAEFARQIGDNRVEVISITPAGTEPHDFEPKPQDLANVYESKLVISNGNGVDLWADKIQPELRTKGITTLRMSDHLTSIETASEEGGKANDPHFWLDPVLAKKEVALVGDALMKLDPQNADLYHRQAQNYTAELDQLDQVYKNSLANCQKRDIVTSHAAFAYLAKRYNMNQIAVTGLSPDQEPSAKQLADIAQIVKEKNITYIFYETLVSPKLADTLAKESGAKTLVFNPLEGLTTEEQKNGANYLSVMRQNLANLRIALGCQ